MERRRFLEGLMAAPLLLPRWEAGASVLDQGTSGRNELYNGIRLPATWPPRNAVPSAQPMAVPYLSAPPRVVRADVGRQLFVDDFLIEHTTLKRTFHQPEYSENNPVIKPDKPWEIKGPTPWAGLFSGGVWYDNRSSLFKMWYTGGFMKYTCYATSKDGMHWEKPNLDIVPGTNIVIDHTKGFHPRPGNERRALDTNSVWMDYDVNATRRYKIFYTARSLEQPRNQTAKWHLHYCDSEDGIHWSAPKALSGHVGDHTNAHYNPFLNQWVIGVRYLEPGILRYRAYVEGRTPAEATRLANDTVPSTNVVPWLGADEYDPHNPNPRSAGVVPQLYQFDGIAYESVMLGFFSIWQGPTNADCAKLHIPKRNEIVLGYSRDGFHYYRPDRRPFFHVVEKPHSWNWGNCQSASGACIVVGDKLYLYCSARSLSHNRATYWDGENNAGLAFLRRDGFASMDSDYEEGTLTTRPLQFRGNHLFVNTSVGQGELRVEVLDLSGGPIEPFTKSNCHPIAVDKTKQVVSWKGGSDLAQLAGRPVRFKFHLRLGELYSFWVSPDGSGASQGYLGSGSPGHNSFLDA